MSGQILIDAVVHALKLGGSIVGIVLVLVATVWGGLYIGVPLARFTNIGTYDLETEEGREQFRNDTLLGAGTYTILAIIAICAWEATRIQHESSLTFALGAAFVLSVSVEVLVLMAVFSGVVLCVEYIKSKTTSKIATNLELEEQLLGDGTDEGTDEGTEEHKSV